jgi:hypothetical protein
MEGRVRGELDEGGPHAEGAMGLHVSGSLGLLHCNHSVNVFLEEDDHGSRREEVRDLVKNTSQNDARSKGCHSFTTVIIQGKL